MIKLISIIVTSYSLVLGPPLAPTLTYGVEHVMNNTFLLSFNWSRPFTWPDFPITAYTIILNNCSSNEMVDEIITIQCLENCLEEPTRKNQLTTEGSTCYQLKLSISANNSLGEGNYSSMTVNHPIIRKP